MIVAVPGVVRAIVNVKDGRVVVEYDPMRASVADLLAAIRGAGFSPAGQTLRLKVSGLYCAECVARIEQSLKVVPGVLDATMNPATSRPMTFNSCPATRSCRACRVGRGRPLRR